MENFGNTSAVSDTRDARAGKLAADVLSIPLVCVNVLTLLRGYERYKAVYSFMELGILTKEDAYDLFLRPAEVQYGVGGLKQLMKHCSAVLKLVRFEGDMICCETSEHVLRDTLLRDPQHAWVALNYVVQLGLSPAIIQALVSFYEIDVTIQVPFRVVRPEVETHRPDISMIDHAICIGDFDVADVLIRHGALPSVASLCHMATIQTPRNHPFDDEQLRYDSAVDYIIRRGVSLDAPMGGNSSVASLTVLDFIATSTSSETDNAPSLRVARAVLSRGADPNVLGRQGLSATAWAVRYWNYKLLRMLLEHGAKIQHTTPFDGGVARPVAQLILSELLTPSFVTSECDDIDASRPFEILKLLVQHGIDVNAFFDADDPTTTTTALLYSLYRNGVDQYGNTVLDKYRKCAHDLCELMIRHVL